MGYSDKTSATFLIGATEGRTMTLRMAAAGAAVYRRQGATVPVDPGHAAQRQAEEAGGLADAGGRQPDLLLQQDGPDVQADLAAVAGRGLIRQRIHRRGARAGSVSDETSVA